VIEFLVCTSRRSVSSHVRSDNDTHEKHGHDDEQTNKELNRGSPENSSVLDREHQEQERRALEPHSKRFLCGASLSRASLREERPHGCSAEARSGVREARYRRASRRHMRAHDLRRVRRVQQGDRRVSNGYDLEWEHDTAGAIPPETTTTLHGQPAAVGVLVSVSWTDDARRQAVSEILRAAVSRGSSNKPISARDWIAHFCSTRFPAPLATSALGIRLVRPSRCETTTRTTVNAVRGGSLHRALRRAKTSRAMCIAWRSVRGSCWRRFPRTCGQSFGSLRSTSSLRR
jgi:hypothetical protein